MTHPLPYVASRLFNTPLAIHPGKARAIVDALGARLLGSELDIDGPEAIAHVAMESAIESMGRLGDPLGRRYQANRESAIDRIDNVAVIPIEGSLIHKGKWVGSYSGDTSYEGIQTRVRQAMADDSIKGVVFELDSFGGEVAGAFDTAALIRSLSAQKPTIAILTDFALSAGYLLASGARQIVMPPSGRAGSIGVITLHADYSAALDKRGVKVTVLSAGKFKGEGNPYEPLGEEVAARIRADLEQARELFADAVAEGRGSRLDKAAALATEADDFRGEDAVAMGLADSVAHSNEAFDAFVAEINAASRQSFGGYSMTTAAVAASRAAGTDKEPTVTLSEHEAAVSSARTEATAQGHAAGKSEGLKEGAKSERDRIKAIVGNEEAKERPTLAAHLAYNTDQSVAEATSLLAASAKETAQKSLDAEMREDIQPTIGASGGKSETQMSDAQKGAAWAMQLLGKNPAKSG